MEQNHIITDKEIVYTFDTWEHYDDLMQYLEDEGVTWFSGDKPTEWQELKSMGYNVNETYILLERGILKGGGIYDLRYAPYKDYEHIHWK